MFAGLNLGETEYFEYTDEFNYQMGNLYLEEYFGIALGVAVGYKFINFNNYSFEVFAGAGRFFKQPTHRSLPSGGTFYRQTFLKFSQKLFYRNFCSDNLLNVIYGNAFLQHGVAHSEGYGLILQTLVIHGNTIGSS